MYCTNCGKENTEGMLFCAFCGKPLPSFSQQNNLADGKNTAMPITGQTVSIHTSPPKPGKGLLIGLIAANTILIAAAIVFIVLLTAAAPAEGLWYSEREGDVLAFDDNGTVMLYKIDGKISGDYIYNNGMGEFSIMDSDFDFEIDEDILDIDGKYEYERVSDEDFDIFAFVNMHTVVSTETTDTQESTPTPMQTPAPQTPKPTATPAEPTPTPTLAPTEASTPVPMDSTTQPEQSADNELIQKIVLNTWYGCYAYASDGSEVYKTESDYYEFYEDGTFIYQYAGGGKTLYGSWGIKNEQLTVFYENSEIGEVTWDIVISTVKGHSVLYFFDIRPGHEGGYWIYSDIPM